MRKTYRRQSNKDYWHKRWNDIPADLPMENNEVYPLKYAEITIKNKNGNILEAGCGAGRILRHYHEKNYNIIGIDFIKVAIDKLKAIDNDLNSFELMFNKERSEWADNKEYRLNIMNSVVDVFNRFESKITFY